MNNNLNKVSKLHETQLNKYCVAGDESDSGTREQDIKLVGDDMSQSSSSENDEYENENNSESSSDFEEEMYAKELYEIERLADSSRCSSNNDSSSSLDLEEEMYEKERFEIKRLANSSEEGE